jgi:hypothetical protein
LCFGANQRTRKKQGIPREVSEDVSPSFFLIFFFTLAISQGFNPCQMLFVSKNFKIRFSKGLPLADVIFITGVHAPGKKALGGDHFSCSDHDRSQYIIYQMIFNFSKCFV